jgi:Zn-finger in Ran binding protein and others
MDTELYQILSLALLGLIVLVLLAVLSSLGRIRKALSERPSVGAAPAAEPAPEAAEAEVGPEPEAATLTQEPAEPFPATTTAAAPEPDVSRPTAEPSFGAPAIGGVTPSEVGREPEPSPFETPAPQPTSATPATQEPAWDEEEDRFAAQYQPTHAAQPAPAAQEPVTAEPAAAEPVAAEPAAAEPVAAEPAAAAQEEPQEQPFERDGKWFFKRGDELLTYEETTGQWIPAEQPHGATSTAPSAPSQAAVPEDTQQLEATPAGGVEGFAEPEAAPAPAGGGFWKCPSCGAVNGSTATTCRMCFTARP